MLNNNLKIKEKLFSLKLAYYNIFNSKYFEHLFGEKESKNSEYLIYLKKRYQYDNNIKTNEKNQLRTKNIFSYFFKNLTKKGSLSKSLILLIKLNLKIKLREKINVNKVYTMIVIRFQPFIGGKTRVKSGNLIDVPYTLSKKENETNVIKTLIKTSREHTEQSRINFMESELVSGMSSNIITSNIFQRKLMDAILLLKNSRGNIKYDPQ